MKLFSTDCGKIACYESDDIMVKTLGGGKILDYTIEPYIAKADTILDIGSHIGCDTIMYSKFNETANIYSFEAQPKQFALLDLNIKGNSIKNVTIFNNAVGNEIKKIKADPFATDPLTNLIALSEDVSMITIDSLNLMGCDFIRISGNGFGKLVLIGAINVIKKYKPMIYFSISDLEKSEIVPSMIEIIKMFGDYSITELSTGLFLANSCR